MLKNKGLKEGDYFWRSIRQWKVGNDSTKQQTGGRSRKSASQKTRNERVGCFGEVRNNQGLRRLLDILRILFRSNSGYEVNLQGIKNTHSFQNMCTEGDNRIMCWFFKNRMKLCLY